MLFLVCRKGRNAVVAVIVLLLLSLDMVYKLLSCAWFIRKNAEMLLLLLVLLCLYCGWSPENCHVVLAVNILDVVFDVGSSSYCCQRMVSIDCPVILTLFLVLVFLLLLLLFLFLSLFLSLLLLLCSYCLQSLVKLL